jgi:hypothetical protein
MRSALITSQVNVTASPAFTEVALAVKLKTFAEGPTGNPSRGKRFGSAAGGAESCCPVELGASAAHTIATQKKPLYNFFVEINMITCPQQVRCNLQPQLRRIVAPSRARHNPFQIARERASRQEFCA